MTFTRPIGEKGFLTIEIGIGKKYKASTSHRHTIIFRKEYRFLFLFVAVSERIFNKSFDFSDFDLGYYTVPNKTLVSKRCEIDLNSNETMNLYYKILKEDRSIFYK